MVCYFLHTHPQHLLDPFLWYKTLRFFVLVSVCIPVQIDLWPLEEASNKHTRKNNSPINTAKMSSTLEIGSTLPPVSFDFLPSTDGEACVYLPLKITNEKIASPSVIVVVPGAFTPTCSEKHIPAYLTTSSIELLKKAGVKNLYVLSVDSPFITRAWGEKLVEGRPEVAKYIYDGYIKFVSDAGAQFLSSVGLVGEPADVYAKNGLRGLRSAIIVGDGGKVEYVGVDRTRGTVVDSGINAVLAALNK